MSWMDAFFVLLSLNLGQVARRYLAKKEKDAEWLACSREGCKFRVWSSDIDSRNRLVLAHMDDAHPEWEDS